MDYAFIRSMRIAAVSGRMMRGSGSCPARNFSRSSRPLIDTCLYPLGAHYRRGQPAKLLVEGGEADFTGWMSNSPFSSSNFALRRQAVPDVLAVLVGSVGVLAAR